MPVSLVAALLYRISWPLSLQKSTESCESETSHSFEQIIAEERASWLVASHRAITSFRIVSHHAQLVSRFKALRVGELIISY